MSMLYHQRPYDYGELCSQSWRRLERGAAEPASPMRLLVLATVGLDGRPSVRIMTLRGVDSISGRLWFHTDTRTTKAADARACPYGAIVAYDGRDGVQIRVSGRLAILTDGPLVEEQWGELAMSARVRYAGPAEGPPVDPVSATDPAILVKRSSRSHFAVIELRAETIDWLQICSGGRRRAVLHASSGWAAEILTA